MSVAARYINRELLAIFSVTLAMLLLVAVGGRFIGYLQEAALGKFTGTTVLILMGLRLPEFVQQVAPFSIFVAIILTLGRLHADQEMVVLQGAGTSTMKLIKWVSVTLSGVVAFVALFSWLLTPLSQQVLADFMIKQRAQTEFETVNAGSFHAYDRGRRVTYARELSDDRKILYDVFLSQRLDDGVQINIWAESGTQLLDADSGSHFLVLQNGRRYEGIPGTTDYRVMAFSQLKQRIESNGYTAGRVEVEAVPSLELGNDPKSKAQWHWRLGLPIFALVGGLLGIGFARVKPRQGRFARIVPGTLIMLVYFLSLLVNHNALVEGGLPPFAGL